MKMTTDIDWTPFLVEIAKSIHLQCIITFFSLNAAVFFISIDFSHFSFTYKSKIRFKQ